MQAEDNFRESLALNALCLCKKDSGKEPPKKCRTNATYKNGYDRHTKALKSTFKPGVFELMHEEHNGGSFASQQTGPTRMDKKGCKFGLHALSPGWTP
eukprot:12202413-Ditylum_brightwellii.AAC.1